MNRERALQFLLLKALWDLRDRDPTQRGKAVARTLSVGSNDGGFIVRWRTGDGDHTFTVRADAVTLYQRGDYEGAAGASADRKNAELARTFALEALGLPADAGFPIADRRGPVRSAWARTDTLSLIVGALLAIVNLAIWPVAILVASIGLSDTARPVSRLAPYAAAAVAIVFGFTWSGLAFAAPAIVLEYLDPDPRARLPAIVLAAALAAAALIAPAPSASLSIALLIGLLGGGAIYACLRLVTAHASPTVLYANALLPLGAALDRTSLTVSVLILAGGFAALLIAMRR
jgi:hypothetical protein